MNPTSHASRELNWPLILIAIVGLILVSPLLFAALVVGLAVTVGLAGILLKAGVVLLVVWAAVMLLKKLFGSSHAAPLPPARVAPPRLRMDPEAEMEREHRESLAALDKELAMAIARKNAAAE